MAFLDPIRFEGSLSGHGKTVPVSFLASINEEGRLVLELDRMPFTRDAFDLHVNGRPTTPVDLLTLNGQSEAGHVFHSDSFTILHFGHGSQEGQELNFQGECYDADLELPSDDQTSDQRRDGLVWLVRQFRTFRRLAHDTPLGRVVIGGPRQDRDAQDPSGFLAIFRSESSAGDEWWAEAERMLTHIARVLSFACDTYLRPVLQERYEAGRVRVRVARQARASAPFMPPFHELHMEPIFVCACDTFFDRTEEIEQLDPAIRWMTAPVAYDEMRLINGMSALENILDSCDLPTVGKYMTGSAFKRVERCVRELLQEIGVPQGMMSKVPELNRPPMHHKVTALLEERQITSHDFPDDWLATVIRQRNAIVHTGVSAEFDEGNGDTLDQTVWVREVLVRIILERLGFVGAYRSWLHQDEQFRFPECVTMQQWVQEHPPAT